MLLANKTDFGEAFECLFSDYFIAERRWCSEGLGRKIFRGRGGNGKKTE